MSVVGFLTRAALAGGWADAPQHHHHHDPLVPPADGVVARVAGEPIPVSCLDARVAAVYRGPMRGVLPAQQSPEGRRLRRWVVQLLTTEALVVGEARRLGAAVPAYPAAVPAAGPVTANGADPATERAVETSVTVLFAHVTADIQVDEEEMRGYYDANPDLWRPPAESYERVRTRIETELLAAARGTAFDDWLALRRQRLVEIAPGFEHPGDPTTPDFIHRH